MADTESQPTPDGASPLRPDASIEEIQARVAHLSSAASDAVGDPISGAGDSATGHDPDLQPPTLEVPALPVAGAGLLPSEPEKPRRRGLRALVGGGGVVLGGLAILVAKFGLKLFAVGVAAAALSGTFGDRYSQLPSGQRDDYEQRYEAAIGTSLDDLSDEEREARLTDLVTRGASRLDDASLVLWSQIDEKARAATDTATCAQIARGWFGPDADRAAVGAAVSKSYDALSIEDLGRIIDLDLKAMEAEKAGTPVRTVSDAAIDPVLAALNSGLSAADSGTLDSLFEGATVTDDAACAALRGVNVAAARLSPAQYATWAVWISIP